MKTQPHATITHASAPDALPLIQVSGALLGIILLILAGAWIAKRFGVGGNSVRGSQGLKVSASASLGPRERVVVVNVEDARLVLGVTAQQVTLLHTLPPASPDAHPVQPAAADFSSLMKSVLKRSGRS
ncbi:flagellar type III secretion system protein FliO [Enterobacteriaceae bacterium G50]|nr:flagellar type III secretion system protein FliO [Enterobacteriaceae bacterium G50]